MNIDAIYYTGDDQLVNMWEGKFSDATGSSIANYSDLLSLRIVDVSIGNKTLNIETLPDGTHYYSGVEPDKTLSLTFRESVDGVVRQLFKDWWNDIFDDRTRRFKSYPKSTKGDSKDKIHKQFELSFLGKATMDMIAGIAKNKVSNIKKLGSSILPSGLYSGVNTTPETEPNFTFKFKNCKLLSYTDPITLSYDDSDPLQWTVSLVYEGVEEVFHR